MDTVLIPEADFYKLFVLLDLSALIGALGAIVILAWVSWLWEKRHAARCQPQRASEQFRPDRPD